MEKLRLDKKEEAPKYWWQIDMQIIMVLAGIDHHHDRLWGSDGKTNSEHTYWTNSGSVNLIDHIDPVDTT
jgi:hypothetical protein